VALEMALVAPLLIALVLGILHTALIFLAQGWKRRRKTRGGS
jgi:Flp pilus assembly protein TadG